MPSHLLRHAATPGTLNRHRRRLIRGTAVLAAIGVVWGLGGIPSAQAVTGYHVVVGSAGLNARSGPGTNYGIVGHLVNGQAIDIACQTKGTLVGTGLPGTPTDVWDRLTNGWFITDYYTSTTGIGGAYTPGIPQCGVAPAPTPQPIYNRMAAVAWAIHNYDLNPNGSPFYALNEDCTNFVSQALQAGGFQKVIDWTDRSSDSSKLAAWFWNPGATKTWASADYFKNHVVNNGIATIKQVSWSDNTAGGAQYGDIIGYDWNTQPDGILDHLAIVTGFANGVNPNVTQHSPQRLDRYWTWDPSAKNGQGDWIQNSHPGARVYLIHIIK